MNETAQAGVETLNAVVNFFEMLLWGSILYVASLVVCRVMFWLADRWDAHFHPEAFAMSQERERKLKPRKDDPGFFELVNAGVQKRMEEIQASKANANTPKS